MISDLERQKDEVTLLEVNQKDEGFAINLSKLGRLLEIKRNYVDVLEANSEQYSAKEIADAKRAVEENQKEYDAMILAQIDVQTTKSTLQKKIESNKVVGADDDSQTVMKLLVDDRKTISLLMKQKKDIEKKAKAKETAKAQRMKQTSGTKPASET